MAAAAAFAGNSAAPADSKNLASAVSQFVSDPAQAAPAAAVVEHVPAAGVIPGAEAHLPPGIDPLHAAGPAPDAAPLAAPATPHPQAAPAPRHRKPRWSHRRPRRHRHPKPPRLRHPHPRAAPSARHREAAPAPAPAPEAAPAPALEAAPAPGRTRSRPGSRLRPRRPGHAGLHVPVDRQRLPGRWRQLHRDGDLGGRAGQDSGARVPRPGRRPTCSPRSARSAPAAEQKLPLNVTWVNLTTGKSGTRDAQATARHQSRGSDDADRDRRHRLGQHHVDDLRPGHHHRQAVPVHADHRLDGGAVTGIRWAG